MQARTLPPRPDSFPGPTDWVSLLTLHSKNFLHLHLELQLPPAGSKVLVWTGVRRQVCEAPSGGRAGPRAGQVCGLESAARAVSQPPHHHNSKWANQPRPRLQLSPVCPPSCSVQQTQRTARSTASSQTQCALSPLRASCSINLVPSPRADIPSLTTARSIQGVHPAHPRAEGEGGAERAEAQGALARPRASHPQAGTGHKDSRPFSPTRFRRGGGG